MVSQYDSIYQLLKIPPKRLAFCLICGECLGKDRSQFSKEHKDRFPTHRNFVVMPIIDPLMLDDPDSWFRRRKINPT